MDEQPIKPEEISAVFNTRITSEFKEAIAQERQADRHAAMLEHYSLQILKELIHADYTTNATLMAERAVHFADELIRALANKQERPTATPPTPTQNF